MPTEIESTDNSAQDAARDLVGSLIKGLSVMEILAVHPQGMTLTEMAEETGLARAGARRFLLTLAASGYAQQDGRRFTLTPKLISVARSWLGRASLWTYAEPFMREASEALNESCSAAVLAGEDVVYVARVPSRHIVSIALSVGTRLPAYCTSMGRVLLSDLDDDELNRFLAGAKIEQRTVKTITGRDAVAAAIRRVKTDGHAIVDEELELGLRSIAVPIRNREGRIEAAINVSTQSARFSVAEMREAFLPHLVTAAGRIESFFAVG